MSTSPIGVVLFGAALLAGSSVVEFPLSAQAALHRTPLTTFASPVVYAVTPSRGPTTGGTPVNIYGAGFTSATTVKFGTVDSSCGGQGGFFVVSDTQISATSPAGALGPVDVVVIGPGGSSPTGAQDKFTYASPGIAVVNGISPNSGPTSGGTLVTLNGSGFTNARQVLFGTTGVFASAASETVLQVMSPPGSAGTVDVTVLNPSGASATTPADRFTFTTPGTPVVQAVAPNSATAGGGSGVVIVGSGFSGASAVHFGATALGGGSFSLSGDNHIFVTAPPGTAATIVDVTVTTPAGTSVATNADKFSYLAPTAPVVSAVVTIRGPAIGGTAVDLFGSGFSGATSVKFGANTATGLSVSSDSLLSVTSPPGAVGAVNITVTTPVGTSAISTADVFTYVATPVPVVYGLAPNSGTPAGGNFVEILGSGFTGVTTVHFGTVAVTTIFNQFVDTQIDLIAPAGAPGTVDVTITTPSGTSTANAGDKFTYIAPGFPVVNAVVPNRGAAGGGNYTELEGSGFTGVTTVHFGTFAATGINAFSDTQITVFIPAGPSGTVDVTVTTPRGTSSVSPADQFTYITPVTPVVTAISPSSGPASGGTTVWISGSALSGVSSVKFGTAMAISFTSVSDNVVEVLGSAAGTGTVDVTVTTSGGTSATTTADQFTYTASPPPVITSVGPSSGPASGGSTVYVSGRGFSGATVVNFGANPGSFFVSSDGSVITATSPAGSVGTIDVTVTTPVGTSALSGNDKFTYAPSGAPLPPSISTVSPNNGPPGGGTTVYITGSHFTGATQINFGPTILGSWFVNNDNLITAPSGSGTPGATVDVTVTTAAGTSATSANDHFTYGAATPPTVTGLSPATGPTAGSTTVYIRGSHMNGVTSVTFGGTAAGFFRLGDDLIQATSPAQGVNPATVDVQVTSAGGTSAITANDHFVYGGPPPTGLMVNGLSPASGSVVGGASVSITGMGFTGATAVSFGTTAAQSFFVSTDSVIFAISPPGSVGAVDVTVTGGAVSGLSNADKFTYTALVQPVVNAVDPNLGSSAGGTSVSIFGSGFSATTTVQFGSALASSFFLDSDTQITASSPAGPGGTAVDVRITNSAGTSATSSADTFTYVTAGPPVVNAVDPNSGTTLGGTTLTIFGSGFSGATSVLFGSTPTFPIFLTDSQLTVATPPRSAGAVDVTVITPGGTSATSTADRFTYVAPGTPVIRAITPNRGGTAGGRLIRVLGDGLSDANAAHFGTTATTIFSIISDSEVDLISPPGSVGTVDVTVTTSVGVSTVGPADRYTYFVASAPSITAVSPSSGAAGTQVFITGTGLSDVTSVLFGNTCVLGFFGLFGSTETSLQVLAPAGPSGTVDVTVISPDGTSAITVNDHFTYTTAALPTVTYVAPASGQAGGGTTVFITGTGLSGVTGITFGSAPALQFAAGGFFALDDNLIEVTSPAGTNGSTVDVRVTTPAGISAISTADQYTYGPTPLTLVTAISPNSGPSGGGVGAFVTGSGFLSATQVNFGATALTPCFFFGPLTPIGVGSRPTRSGPTWVPSVQLPTATQLPIHDPTRAGQRGAPHFATVFVPSVAHPLLTGLARQPAPTSHTAPARFFPTPCLSGFEALTDNLIRLISPPGAVGTVDITVTSAGGTSATTAADHYAYTATPAPVVSAVSPSGGPSAGGTTVFVSGRNLMNASTVKFGGIGATIIQNDPELVFFAGTGDSLVEVLSPAGTNPSTVDVTVTTAGGTSATSTADHFTYGLTPTPSVSAVSVGSGPIGTTVFITGAGFLGTTAVDFGLTPAVGFTVISDTLIQTTSPSHAVGLVDVRVVTPGGTSLTSTADQYTYTASPTPVVAAVSPASGTAGTVVYITGSGLGAASAVAFGATSATFVLFFSDTLIRATSPAGSGTVDVRVTTPAGTSAINGGDTFTYGTAPPAVAVLPAMSNGAYGGYVTAVTIQNTGSATANIQIAYFDQNGAPVGTGDSIVGLPVNASWTVRQDNGNSFPSSGGNAAQAGSAVVSSSQPIAAFVNEFAPGNVGDATSYSAVPVPSGVGPTLYAPTIVNNAFGGYTTGIGLLNEGSISTNVTITYRDGSGTVIKTQMVTGLAAHAYQALYSGDLTLALPNGFAGTGTITSSTGQPLGAVVNETGPGGQFSSYDAVPSGSSLLNVPVALNNAFGGFFTGMGIQNTSASAGTVTVTYYDASGTPTAKSFPIPANGSLAVYQGSVTDGPAPGAYTAVIQSSTVPLAAIVNEVAPAGSAQQSTSYNTFSAGSSSLRMPLVENAGSDSWNTGDGIMNTGTSSTTVTVTYFNTITGAAIGTAQMQTLAPHAFWGLYQPTGGLPSGSRATAVVTTSTGGQVAVICNESSSTTFMSYDAQ